jgi:actin-like ATPase involved in cell morphogenesis
MDLGIDLGTANTVVSDVRRGIVFDEPSVMLVGPGRARRPQIQALGTEAADLLGRPRPGSPLSGRCTRGWSRIWRPPGSTCGRS